jgi:predicted SnoaL-like aldol condensation-catalyzing enzyme
VAGRCAHSFSVPTAAADKRHNQVFEIAAQKWSANDEDDRNIQYSAQVPDSSTYRKEWVPKEGEMTQTIEEKNKALVLEAFETLFNKKDYAAAERFWSPSYIQHSKHIPPGRDGLFGLIKTVPEAMRYENGAILAEGNLLMLHGRITGLGLPANWIVVDIVRLENGLLAEHWDVIEDEATRETSVSGLPMFGPAFPLE